MTNSVVNLVEWKVIPQLVKKTLFSFCLICEFELLETSAEFVHRSGGQISELEELFFTHAIKSH